MARRKQEALVLFPEVEQCAKKAGKPLDFLIKYLDIL